MMTKVAGCVFNSDGHRYNDSYTDADNDNHLELRYLIKNASKTQVKENICKINF